MPDFPKNPYKGQIFYDPESETTYEYFVPKENDYFCKKLKIKPKWVVPSYESELVNGLFSKNGKVKYFSYKKLIVVFRNMLLVILSSSIPGWSDLNGFSLSSTKS